MTDYRGQNQEARYGQDRFNRLLELRFGLQQELDAAPNDQIRRSLEAVGRQIDEFPNRGDLYRNFARAAARRG